MAGCEVGMKRIKELKNSYAGKTAFIVGCGPSLSYMRKSHFGSKENPVIVLDKAISNVAGLAIPNDVFLLWRKGDCPPDLPEYKARLILCTDPVYPFAPSANLFLDYEERYIFDCIGDFGMPPKEQTGQKAAIEIAVRIFGCTKLIFIAFDACQCETASKRADALADALGISVVWNTPKPPEKRAPKKKKKNKGAADRCKHLPS